MSVRSISARIAGIDIVNLGGRGMLVASLARRLGSEGALLPIVLPGLIERGRKRRPGGLVTRIGIERGQWAGYHEPWFSFRIAAIAFRPTSFSTRSGFICA